MIATLFELYGDRHGDFNKQGDLIWRVVLILAEAGLLAWLLHKPFVDSILLSSAIFFLVFDYLIAYVLIKNGTLEPPRGITYYWFDYIAKVGPFDNFKYWKALKPRTKLFVRVVVLIGAVIIYIV